jgi:hypothetical protein
MLALPLEGENDTRQMEIDIAIGNAEEIVDVILWSRKIVFTKDCVHKRLCSKKMSPMFASDRTIPPAVHMGKLSKPNERRSIGRVRTLWRNGIV